MSTTLRKIQIPSSIALSIVAAIGILMAFMIINLSKKVQAGITSVPEAPAVFEG